MTADETICHLEDVLAGADPGRAHEAILNAALHLFRADAGGLFGMKEPERPVCLAARGLPDAYLRRMEAMERDDPAWDLLSRRDISVCRDAAGQPVPLPMPEGFRAEDGHVLVVAPLAARDHLAGWLQLFLSGARHVRTDDVEALRTFCALAAAALENGRLRAENARRAERLRLLHEASLALSGALDPDEIARTVYRQVVRMFHTNGFRFAVWNPDRDAFSVSLFQTDTSPVHLELDSGKHPEGWVLRHRRAHRWPFRGGGTDGDEAPGPEMSGSLVSVPLVSDDRLLGVMSAVLPEHGTGADEEMQAFQMLTEQAAVALTNAHRYRTAEDASFTDDLTGLPNRRALRRRLDEEISRAARHGQPLCVLLLDFDHFKQVNDTLGHPSGDAVLCELADLLRGSLRTHDVLGRWGGEEFVILLTQTDRQGGGVAAENLRRTVSLNRFLNGRIRQPMSVSIGGLAVEHPLRVETGRLLEIADACLYRAKAMGRNRTVMWSGTDTGALDVEG